MAIRACEDDPVGGRCGFRVSGLARKDPRLLPLGRPRSCGGREAPQNSGLFFVRHPLGSYRPRCRLLIRPAACRSLYSSPCLLTPAVRVLTLPEFGGVARLIVTATRAPSLTHADSRHLPRLQGEIQRQRPVRRPDRALPQVQGSDQDTDAGSPIGHDPRTRRPDRHVCRHGPGPDGAVQADREAGQGICPGDGSRGCRGVYGGSRSSSTGHISAHGGTRDHHSQLGAAGGRFFGRGSQRDTRLRGGA